jgi:hypothetical protein
MTLPTTKAPRLKVVARRTRLDDIQGDLPDKEEGDGADDDGAAAPSSELAIEFLQKKAETRDAQLKSRKREVKRLNRERIEDRFGKKTSQSLERFACCANYCFRSNRSESGTWLVQLSYQLREVLALESTSAQNDILYALLKDRWGFTQDKNTGELVQGICKGYAIPEVHGGAVICR